MVLSAPSTHDELHPREADWLEQIKLGLRLSKAAILIHVDWAVPERLGDLVRALVGEHPELDVHADLGAVATAPEGSVMVLLAQAEHADWLNRERPIFARRKLKVVLFCEHETSIAIAQRAPDFFDWISQHHDCPPGPAAHVIAGLRCAQEAGAPGVLWRGSDDTANTGRIWGAFSAAFPGAKLMWIDPKRDYAELVFAVRAAKDAWIACPAGARAHVRRLRWAMAEVKRQGRAIVVTESFPCPGWWPIHDRLMPFHEARRALEEAGAPRSGALAALAGLEPEAVELLAGLFTRGPRPEDLIERLRGELDPGALLAKMARGEGPLYLADVARSEAPPPAMRAFAGEPEVKELREQQIAAIDKAFTRGERVSTEDMGRWAASREDSRAVSVLVDVDAIGYAVELRLRHASSEGAWVQLAQLALFAGEVDAAGVWALRAQNSTLDSSSSRDLEVVAERLAELGDARAPAIKKLSEQSTNGFCLGIVLYLILLPVGVVLGKIRRLDDAIMLLIGFGVVFSFAFSILKKMIALLGTLRSWRTRKTTESRLEQSFERARDDQRRGDYESVVLAMDQIIVAEQAKLTEEHIAIRRALAQLALALIEEDEDERAEELLRRAIAVEGRIVGVEAHSFVSLIPSLASVLSRTGRARDAERLLRKLLGREQALPPGETGQEPAVLMAGGNVEADEYLKLFLALPGALPLSVEARARALRLFGETLIMQGRYDEAEHVLERAAERAEATLSKTHAERWRTLLAFGTVLSLQGRPEQAETILRRAAALAQKQPSKRPGAPHPDHGRILDQLARVEHRHSPR